MGGGASQGASIEQLLTTTYMIGRTIAAITCPGMYRIYDFHSSLAPKLKFAKHQFVFFGGGESDDDDDDDEEDTQPDPVQYSRLFQVQVGEDTIYIENPTESNDAGWTPLHACCMSFLTVPAGHKLIEETLRQGASLNIKTIAGPGTFNKDWTPLHMACAYGVEPLVERLVNEGADVNSTNCFGYTPMLEACHRGFVNIVGFLIKGGVNLRYIPPDEEAMCSPFANAPAQTPLGEASRCGFPRIVQSILDAGAPKDQANKIGWTALHEACFYNRAEVAKTLLLAGANATIRTRMGALPYHFAGLEMVRTMLKDIGGPDAVPEPGDKIDMVQVLQELTMSETSIVSGADGTLQVVVNPSSSYPSVNDADDMTTPQKVRQPSSSSSSTSANKSTRTTHSSEKQRGDEEKSSPALLHSGPILGDLPSLSGGKVSPGKISTSALNMAIDQPDRLSPSHRAGPPGGGSVSRKADEKKKKKKDRVQDRPPADMPQEFLCQLTGRPMSEPVKTVYGNTYDKATILNWLNSQGKICPLTGAPLAENELQPLEELGDRIRSWILQKSLGKTSNAEPETPTHNSSALESAAAGGSDSKADPDEDLYDF